MKLNETIRKTYGEGVSIARRIPISGGDINKAYALELSDGGRVFMKSNRKENGDYFRAETEGRIKLLLDFTDRAGDEVADPWYTGNFDATWRDVTEGLEGLLIKLGY